MNILPAINGIGHGWTAGGSYSFIDLPPGTYQVWETQQPGWIATTDVERTITVAANDFVEVWFGNVQLDMGDLPVEGTANTPYAVHYPTQMAQDGPRHVIRDIQMGEEIDAECDGCPCYCCGGDDANQPVNDEDGVAPVDLASWFVGEDGGAVDVRVTGIGSTSLTTGYVNAWIDWNQNGYMEAAEQILVDAPVPVGTTQTLVFDIPEDAGPVNDVYYARFRLYDAPQGTRSTADGGMLSNATPTGLALNGEVEDYRWYFAPLAVTLAAFDAQPYGEGVLVSWETVSEIDNAGFNLYRTGSAGAQPAPADLLAYVPSQAPGSTQGAFYSYFDADVLAGHTYWYWLADVDLSGATTLHGPVSATVQAPTAVTLSGASASPGLDMLRYSANAAGAAALPWLWVAVGAGAALALGRRRR